MLRIQYQATKSINFPKGVKKPYWKGQLTMKENSDVLKGLNLD